MLRLIALHAHPDDESSKGAGTVAKYVDAGARAVLVTATGGEAGDILNPAMDRPEVKANLAAVRRTELEEAAKVIGYHDVILLGYRDSGMPDTQDNARPDAFTNAADDEVLGRLVEIVRREKPQVVLGYDSHERYPHPDHLAIHRHGLELFTAAADPDCFPEAGPPWAIQKLYAPVFSVKRLVALHEVALAAGRESPYADWLERMDPEADFGKRLTSIDVAATLGRGRDALRAHRTQVDPDGFWFSIPEELVLKAYPYEDFELLASRVPVENNETDLFAGIDAS
jgi:mycothiol S-conjugate amidase